jgi:hypothetical protein
LRDVLEHWSLVLVDLHETFGADFDDPATDRAWPWWRDRIWGLLSTDSRLHRALIDQR